MGPLFRATLLAALSFALACTGPDGPPATMLVRVRLRGDAAGRQDFVVRAARVALIDSIRAEMSLSESARHHINGALQPAASGENLQWHWAIVPDDWGFAEMSVELCDATSQMVEDNLSYWLNTVKRFCPWSSFAADTTWIR